MSASTDAAEINIGYLRRTDPKSTLSLIQTPANNDGIAGARLAIDDNNTTGRFLNQQFSLEDVPLAAGANAAAGTIALAERGVSLVVTDLPSDELLNAADAGPTQGIVFQCRRERRSIAGGRLPRQCGSYCSNTVDAGRRSGTVSGLEAVAQMAFGRRFPCRGQALWRCAATLGQAVRRANCPGQSLRRYRRRAKDGQRRGPDSASATRFHARRACLRCSRSCGRERGLCILFAVPDLGSEAGRRVRGPRADKLGRLARPMGSGSAAGPIHETVLAANDRTRHAGLDRSADDRRERVKNAFDRPEGDARFPQRARFCLGRVQGPAIDATRLESSTSSTHSSERRQNDRFGLSARRISAPGFRTGYARDRPSRKSM